MSNDSIINKEDQMRLENNLSIRSQLIASLVADGKTPDDRSTREFLVSLLDGMDRTILARAKVKNDANSVNAQNNTAAVIAQVLSKISPKDIINQTSDKRLDSSIQILDIVPGEMDEGINTSCYDNFMSDEE